MLSADQSDQSDPEASSVQIPGTYAAELPTWRKYLILFVVSWSTLVVTFSSTSLLIATPEISADLSTTSEIINVTNAAVLIAMGCSPLIWSPLSDIFGRRKIYNIAIVFMFVPSIGTALSPNMATFTAMRVLGGLTGTYFMVAGQTIIADIFEPVSPIIHTRRCYCSL
jgi:MFS family permease